MESCASASVNIAAKGHADDHDNPKIAARYLKGIPTKADINTGFDPAYGKDSNELQSMALTWLNWQCRMVSGATCGALFIPENKENIGEPVAQWLAVDGGVSLLTGVAELAQSKANSTIRGNQPYGIKKGQSCDLLACPLIIDDKVAAVVSLMISPRSQPQRHAVMQLLEWGMLWLENLLRQEVAARHENGEVSLQLLSSLLGHDSSKAAAIEATNILADHLDCERVSIGLCSDLSTRLVAVSHLSHFDSDSQLIREIEAAMDEAVDQSSCIQYPTGPESLESSESSESVTQAHVCLARQRGKAAICTIPLAGRAGYIGAITFERELNEPFSNEDLAHCKSIALLIGPVIELMMQDERPMLAKGVAGFRLFMGRLLGLNYLKLKLAVLSAILILIGLSVTPGEHKVKATASLQGKVRQLLVAPQDGYINKGMVTAGDLVDSGELLASLDDRTLRLERQKWLSEKNKLMKEYQQAFSKRDRTQLGILKAQIDQVTAEIQLIDDKISRMALRAPFDGVVVSGDLSQAQGSPVTLGQVLFEVTPLDNYRVMLEVDEHDIGQLKSGQTGKLVMAALPQTTFSFTLEKVIPVAISSDGYNYFRVEARLDQPSPLLRPGMQGVAKIAIQQRDLLWVLSHDVVDRLRLWFWSLGVVG